MFRFKVETASNGARWLSSSASRLNRSIVENGSVPTSHIGLLEIFLVARSTCTKSTMAARLHSDLTRAFKDKLNYQQMCWFVISDLTALGRKFQNQRPAHRFRNIVIIQHGKKKYLKNVITISNKMGVQPTNITDKYCDL